MARRNTTAVRSMLEAKGAPPVPTRDDYVSTGITLLNLALSGRATGGLVKGGYYAFIGDSGSGKSWIGHLIMAEATLNSNFDDYQLVYYAPEFGAMMDVTAYFGKRLAERMQVVAPPHLEGFYDDLLARLLGKNKVIAVLDSQDALRSAVEVKETAKKALASAKPQKAKKPTAGGEEKKEKGSYGVEKAKVNSTRLPHLMTPLKETGSIFVMLNQTRHRIGPGAMFDPKTFSGGDALTFYAHTQVWTSIVGKIKRAPLASNKDKKVVVGQTFRARVKKNRLSGRDRAFDFTFYPTHGVDDVGSNVNYLIEWEKWGCSKLSTGEVKSVVAPEFDFEGRPEELVELIEQQGREGELQKLVAQYWRQLDDAIAIIRKNKYALAE